MDDFLCLEITFREVVRNVPDGADVTQGSDFLIEFTTLEGDDAVGQRIVLVFLDVLPYASHQVNHWHDCARHNKVVVLLLDVFATSMSELHVVQLNGFSHSLSHLQFLPDAVNQMETRIWEKYSQRNARESATAPQVEDMRVGAELYHLCDGQGMKHMMQVEVLDVLARNDINLSVPVRVQSIECLELTPLLMR